jgi:hypothetical protein
MSRPTVEELQAGILQFCQINHHLRLRMGAPVSFEGYLLDNARFFSPVLVKPKGVKWGERKECFYNAAYHIYDDLIRRRQGEWAYCEGLAVSADLGLPIHHGWLVNRDGAVLDRTWRHAEEGRTAYFGVAFSPDYFADTISETRVWGMFCPGITYNVPLISGEDGGAVFHSFHNAGVRPKAMPVDPAIVGA